MTSPDRSAAAVSAPRRNGSVGDGLSAAFELVATPGIFGVAGYLLDNRLGTVPVFTLVFTVIVLSYVVWKFWHTYSLDVAAEAEKRRAHNQSRAKAEAGLSRRERQRPAS
jgi:F0F1-type ATP synthase assembly protein I